MAVLVAAYGLSAAIFSQIYHHAVAPNVATFFWILAAVLGSLPILGVALVRPINQHQTTSNTFIPDSDSPSPTSGGNGVELDAVDTLSQKSEEIDTETVPLDLDTLDNYHPARVASPPPGSTTSTLLVHHTQGKYGDLRGLPVIKNVDFLLLFSIVMCCTGIGLTWINILGSIVASYSITPISASTYVISLSVANAIGRLVFGSLTDLKLVRLPPVYLMLPCLTMLLVSHFVLIFTTNYIVLLLVTLITGFSYGGSFSVMPVVINKYFGDKNYGSNLGLLLLAVAFSSMAMGFASGAMYDYEAEIQDTTAPTAAARILMAGVGSKMCHGLACFRYTYVMTCCVSIAGLILTTVVLRREMAFDRRMAIASSTSASNASADIAIEEIS